MNLTGKGSMRPRVQLVGQFHHADFCDALQLLNASAQIVPSVDHSPELILVAQSRAAAVSTRQVQELQHAAPLAGVVGLLGSWCEGEARTGRPWPGVSRIYWYHFPAWWRRQMALRAAGRCPDWARRGECGSQVAGRRSGNPRPPQLCRGIILLRAAHRDTAEALTDVLQSEQYAVVWQADKRPLPVVRGAVAGVWDGGQLDAREAESLAVFCRKLVRDRVPVIALLDFPRRDRVEIARQIGAAAVVGKPWLNEDLLATVEAIVHASPEADVEPIRPAA